MKVTIEGTAEELLDLVEIIAYGRDSLRAIRVPKNTDTSRRDVGVVQTGDDVPNRYREEGVQ